jgi:hypothetical protein
VRGAYLEDSKLNLSIDDSTSISITQQEKNKKYEKKRNFVF